MTEEVRAREKLNECPRAVCLGSGGGQERAETGCWWQTPEPRVLATVGTVLLPLNLLQGTWWFRRLFLHNNLTCGHISASDPLISLWLFTTVSPLLLSGWCLLKPHSSMPSWSPYFPLSLRVSPMPYLYHTVSTNQIESWLPFSYLFYWKKNFNWGDWKLHMYIIVVQLYI